ncbi:MAG: hypothetical protein HOD63_06805 [Bacteroidetes bacterium]|nr:hypothetical protein [Bacteroidota bacterium]MBT5529038.1 hypothetical protein [Cytophagia bacterium]MBT3422293.1 hypothetical protein [Bacteroidota bacterium]MBT4338280.1 hypothetical protein [Bacteroidota bacterium]MBT5990528.1 hypothetical protein [Bacteroidota bacterium]
MKLRTTHGSMMQSDRERKYKLIRRQIIDIIVQVDKVKSSRSFKRDMQEISKYSSELLKYIVSNVAEKEIISIAEEIPEIDIARFQRHYWYHYLLFPWYFTLMYNELLAKGDIIPLLEDIKNKYNNMCKILNEIIGEE